jgi:MerR family transcriptional regulator, thiopeptide resistance regulator
MPTIERIIPILVYEDIPAAHDFLVEAFGFTSGGVERDGEGRAVHAEVRAGDAVIWLHRVAAELSLASPRSLPAAGSGLVVYVEDIDAHYQAARAGGAHLESEPRDMPYGQREYGARDPEGHRWWFAAPLKSG